MSDKKKILWVEDDTTYQNEMEQCFGGVFAITFVTNDKAAEAKLKKNEHDLLVVDLHLAREKNAGAIIIKKTKEQYPALPIIIVSSGKVKEMRGAQAKGAKEILSKSEIDIEEWVDVFNEYTRPTVFLSHSSVDKPFVEMLARDLTPHCAKVWFDQDSIDPGARFIREIDKGIKETNTLVLLATKKSVASEWVKEELEMAYVDIRNGKKKGKILVVRLEECDVPSFLRTINQLSWIELYGTALKNSENLNVELFWLNKKERIKRYKQIFQLFDKQYKKELTNLINVLERLA